MNIKALKILLLIFVASSISSTVTAQVKTDESINGRYIIIDDINTFFDLTDETATCNLTIYNILDSESSKPIHIEVNGLKNVVKFSIKSTSGTHEKQRNSTLVLKKDSYLSTFRSALIKMEIAYVKYKGELLEIDEFYSQIN